MAQCIELSLSESYIGLIVKYSNFPSNWQFYDLVSSLQRTAADCFRVSKNNDIYNQVEQAEARYQRFRALQIIKSLVVDWEGFIKELLPSESMIEQFFLRMDGGCCNYKVRKIGDNYLCYEVQDHDLSKYEEILAKHLGIKNSEMREEKYKHHRLHGWKFTYEGIEYWIVSQSKLEEIVLRTYSSTINYEEIEFLFPKKFKDEKFSKLISFYLNKFSPEESIKDWDSTQARYLVTSFFKNIKAYKAMTYRKFEKNPERFFWKILGFIDGYFIIEEKEPISSDH